MQVIKKNKCVEMYWLKSNGGLILKEKHIHLTAIELVASVFADRFFDYKKS